MSDNLKQGTLFEMKKETQTGPVTCLGLTFENDEARRAYFTEELRKKLPELKKIEGFPVGEDEDILALSDPPYFTVCPNPWLFDFISEWNREKKSSEDTNIEGYNKEPFTADVSEGKTDSIYKAHGYHTKVPHKAIMRYLLHYTNPGDIVWDGFAGTGMTGVAGQLCNDETELRQMGFTIEGNNIINQEGEKISERGIRKTILSDLSPAATFISSNFNLPIEKESLSQEIKKIMGELKKYSKWMYEVNDPKYPNQGEVFYTIWSDVFICPSCSGEINYWNEAVEKDTQKLKAEFSCPNCGVKLTKRGLERSWETVFDGNINSTIKRAKQTPVAVNLKYGSNRMERGAESLDTELLKSIDAYIYDGFYPTDKLPFGYNTAQPINSHGFTHVHHLYTRRSLLTLSKFYQLASRSKYRNNLLAMLTGVAFATTKLYRWTPNYEGGGPLSGTYYIPALYREISALDALKRFGEKLPKNMGFSKNKGNTIISVDSATTIQIPDNSIDYIFVDPPFGGNIMYSELNFLWESWLKVKTNNKDEAIINEKHDKQIFEYRKLMEFSFANFYRALKPGKWITVEFSNSQASIWNAIRESIERAGFIIANVSALDKKQGSFKAITTTTAVKQDLVISAYKPKSDFVDNMLKRQNSEESAWLFVEQHLQQLPVFVGGKGAAELIVERTPRILFDRMIAYHVQHSLSVPISSADFQLGVEQRFPMRDGMAFLEEQVAEYDKKRTLAKEFTQMTLFVSDENSAIEWLRQQLMRKPQTRQDLHPNYMKEIQHIAKHEELPELDTLLEQNFLKYDGHGEVPTQLLRNLSKNDPGLKLKAKDRWYVPDPNKQADLEKLREKSLLREFETYRDGLVGNRKKLKQFRTEAIRAGFKKAWGEKDYQTIVTIGERLPENVLQEDDKLLMYYDNAQIRLGL